MFHVYLEPFVVVFENIYKKHIFDSFEELASGNYPLGVKKVDLPDRRSFASQVRNSVNELNKFEAEIYVDSAKNRKNKRKSPTEGETEAESLQLNSKSGGEDEAAAVEEPVAKRKKMKDVGGEETPGGNSLTPLKKRKKKKEDEVEEVANVNNIQVFKSDGLSPSVRGKNNFNRFFLFYCWQS